jgi:N-acetyl-1-D-myo-inositol-2-amino-2-deoxy-alpha-D-glucopyranoside deacetylase
MTINLLGVFAHPDDDVYSLGATLIAHRGELRTTLAFATSGEAGPITDPDAVSREDLGAVREQEQRAAMEALEVAESTESRFFRLPDYYLPDVGFDDLADRITVLLHEVRPHVVVTFGPDGMTSHHDHIRVGEATTAAFDRLDGDQAPGYLFHVALPRTDVDRFYADLEEAGYGEEGDLFNVAGVPDEQITVRFDARPYRETKLQAILAHRTQICEWERIPEPLRWIYLDEEAFVQARPRHHVGAPRSDLFAGVGATDRSGT